MYDSLSVVSVLITRCPLSYKQGKFPSKYSEFIWEKVPGVFFPGQFGETSGGA
jgi:hypothetical protein